MASSDNKEAEVITRALPGFLELEPKQQIVFQRIRSAIEEVYRAHGFSPIETPVIERAEVLLAKDEGETQKQMYRFMRGDNDLGLRFDLTVPLARFVSEHYHALTFPFRAYQIGKVFRAERPQRGRYRELYQCDVDILGREKLAPANDAEILSVAYRALSEIGLPKFTIRLNNRKVLNGMLATLGEKVDATLVLRAIDKLEKIGESGVTEELGAAGVSAAGAAKVLEMIRIANGGDSSAAVLKRLAGLGVDAPLFREGLEELTLVWQAAALFGIPESHLKVDVAIARGLGYYTGTVYETQVDSLPELGSVCSGGRYENLVGVFSEHKVPGVGISIGLTRIFGELLAQGKADQPAVSYAQAAVLPMLEDLQKVLPLVADLRAGGIPTLLYSESGKFKDKMRYASAIGVPFVIIIGEDEIAANAYSVKDMRSGEQKKLGRDELIAFLKAANI